MIKVIVCRRQNLNLEMEAAVAGPPLPAVAMCKTFTMVSSESSASVVSAEHCSTTSTTWSVTSVAAARGPTPMFIL